MINIFKDIKASYLIVGYAGLFLGAFFFFTGMVQSAINLLFILLLWVICCILFFDAMGVRRYKKIVNKANNEGKIKEVLPELYYYYNSEKSSHSRLYFAMAIAGYLNQIGKSKEGLELLSQYDAEKIFKRKRQQLLKYNYYMTLSACLFGCGDEKNGLSVFEKAGEILHNSKAKESKKLYLKEHYELQRRFINIENEDKDDVLRVIDEHLSKCKHTLQKVSFVFKSVQILLSLGRADEAQEKINYLATNGGDSLAGRCAREKNFTPEFIESIRNEPFELKAAPIKKHKTVLISIVIVILAFAITLLAGVLNRKTIYISGTNDDFVQHTFNAKGEYDNWISMDTVYYDSAEYKTFGLDLQNLFASFYENREGIYITRTTTDEFSRCRIDIVFDQLTENSTKGFDKSFFYTEDEFLASLDSDMSYSKYIQIFNVPIRIGSVE